MLLQLSFFSRVALFHISPDVLPALVVSFGLLGGTMTGAVTGFSIGFLLDCLLIEPLGGASLVLLAPATSPASSASASRSTAPWSRRCSAWA